MEKWGIIDKDETEDEKNILELVCGSIFIEKGYLFPIIILLMDVIFLEVSNNVFYHNHNHNPNANNNFIFKIIVQIQI